MNAVKNNPYRTIGLFGNSSEKELQKQIAIIKRFAEVGKTKAFDYDFPFFGEVVRSTEKVQEAASKLEQAKNKVLYALFWFLNSGHIDEAALNNLKGGNIEKATEIWEKTLKDSMVTSKNFAAINNLSTLQLGIITYNGSFDSEKFSASVDLKGKLLLSEVFNDFVTTVIGEGISISRDVILNEFADEILQIVKPYLNKPNSIKSRQLIDAFSSFPNEIKQYVSGKFTDKPLNNIENQIEITKQKRDDNPNDAEEYGEELYKNTKEDLIFLKNVWGSNNVQYRMTVNKLANEILQCAIDFFVEYRDSYEYDPGEPAMKVMKMAKAINPTGQTKSRLDENIENLQEWIDNSDERNIQRKVHDELVFISLKLERFQKLSNTVANAEDLVVSCKPKLNTIKTTLGSTNDIYLRMSSAVVGNAQDMLVIAVNVAQETFKRHQILGELVDYPTYSGTSELKLLNRLSELETIVVGAYEVTRLLSSFDMDKQLRIKFDENRNILGNIKTQIQSAKRRTTTSYYSSSSNSSSGGCYIATMAYGSYEHPQVLELRKFRDNTLSKSSFGRGFIKTYYKYSPRLVEHLKDKPLVNQTIKSILNTLIRIIK
jgi:hypothetical protein